MTNQSLVLFEEHRQLLFGIAYRMLGTVTDAQDLVQDAYVRWQQVSPAEIRSPRAWLTTAITRLCLNHLQLARVQRETYVGPWLPEPLVDDRAPDPAEVAQRVDTLSLGLLVLLETLNPVERAVFILREGFDCDFAEIARTVEKSEANCRQILARARQRIDERRPRYEVSRADAEKVVAPFLAAMTNGDIASLLARLAENVTLVADAGDKPGALLRPLEGAEAVARAMTHAVRKHSAPTDEVRRVTINGLPGVIRYRDGRAQAVLAFGLAGGRIVSVFVISNPEKLRHLHTPTPAMPPGR
jgi:RNA polymerase sigma-70 factor (ECF subfamily)